MRIARHLGARAGLRALAALGVALGAASSGCGREPEPVTLPKPAPFIAFERDFQRFRDWRELDLEKEKEKAQGITHGNGRTRAWVNAMPPKGSKHFPVGTVIVRQIDAQEGGPPQIFAMAKRGAGYNPKGAPGWEWFELKERADGSLALLWRGPDVRAGNAYTPGPAGHPDDPLGGCNGCHQMATKNDYVLNKALQLDIL